LSAHEALRQMGLVQLGEPVIAHHTQGKLFLQLCHLTSLQPLLQAVVQLQQQGRILWRFAVQEIGHQGLQALTPDGRRSRVVTR